MTAVFPAWQWQVARPESQGVDSAKLASALDNLREYSGPDDVDQVIVVRNDHAASGYNNNDMFIIPPWKMVIVRLDQNRFRITDVIYAEFLRRIGASLNP